MKCALCHRAIDGTDYKTKNKKRYHIKCYDELINNAEKTNQQKAHGLKNHEKDALVQYICSLYSIDKISHRIEKQIDDFVGKRQYTYSGIQKTLYYFYELEGNEVGDYTDTIGIVPHCYEDARAFFEATYTASAANENFIWDEKTVHVKIKPKSRSIPCVIDIENL